MSSKATTGAMSGQPSAKEYATSRTVVLRDSVHEVLVQVPVPLWHFAQHTVQKFLESHQTSEASVSRGELLSRFMRHLLAKAEEDPEKTSEILFACVECMSEAILEGEDIHCSEGATGDSLTEMVEVMFSSLDKLRREGFDVDRVYHPRSRLVAEARKGDIKLCALFGGQGTDYFKELRNLLKTYRPLVGEIFTAWVAALNEDAMSTEAQSTNLVSGMDVEGWLEVPPSDDYLLSAPVSMPLIGITQLLQYAVSLRSLNLLPGEMRDMLCSTTGHSQGVLAAVVASSSKTWEDFCEQGKKAVRILFWMGLRSQQLQRPITVNPSILQDSHAAGEGIPQPMLSITSLSVAAVEKMIEETNKYLDEDKKIHLSLVNGTHQVVASGPRQSLYGLNVSLRKLKGAGSTDQARVPHSKRKNPFTTTYLPSSVPFHSPYLAEAPRLVLEDVARLTLQLNAKDMAVAVLSTDDGSDVRGAENLMERLVTQICSAKVEWPMVCRNMKASHILDFGPGGISGAGKLVYHNSEGTGVVVIVAGVEITATQMVVPRSAMYSTTKALPRGVNWGEEFAPKLVKCAATGEVHISTRFSRLLGRPPIMVPGMTPTTISGKLISATLNAGFQIEISGGGHFTNQMLRDKIDAILENTGAGEGVSINMLFLNQFLWGMQFPHVQEMRRAGVPIEGITIAAGVPSPDKAHEYITAFRDAGIKHVSFKPGAEATIRQVAAIAEAHPDFPIVMQWTGGRAGGHHSFEDQHEPMLKTYSLCRRHPNLVLVVGGGLGDAEGSLPWLTGEWSTKFGRPPMPFDGVLMGSRLMVAKEAETAPEVKKLIVEAPGIPEGEQHTWETTYTKPHGGILTVTSELGEPIHKIANRGVRLWKELDDTIFSLPRDKQLAIITEKKQYLIKRLNEDAQKVYFPAKKNGTPCDDLSDMTYEEVALRLVALLYDIGGAWVDITMRNLTGKWLRRVEERFAGKVTASMLPNFDVLSTPGPFLTTFFETYRAARTQYLTMDDVHHFISLCAFPAQKPVPFVPRLDERFNSWFKKDSLWQSENLQFVVGHDADRVNILHGPVAARYSTTVDEPVKDILGGIYAKQIELLQQSGTPVSSEVEYFGGPEAKKLPLPGVEVAETDGAKTFTVTTLPDDEAWLQAISGEKESWLKALATAGTVVQGKGRHSRWIDNPMRKVLRPRKGMRATLHLEKDGLPRELALYMADSASPAVHVSREGTVLKVLVYALSQHHSTPIPLELLYEYIPAKGARPIHEVMDTRIERVKRFYARLWLGDKMAEEALAEERDPWEMEELGKGTPPHVVTRASITEFCHTVGNTHEYYVDRGQKVLYAPFDYAMVAGWKSVVRALFAKKIDGDLLQLVHLGNTFRVLVAKHRIKEGDALSSTGSVMAVENDAAGNKVVKVKGIVSCNGTPCIEILSSFLYRGAGGKWDDTFSKEEGTPFDVDIPDSAAAAVVKTKEWIKWTDADPQVEGQELTFYTSAMKRYRKGGGFSHLTVTGRITTHLSTKEEVEVGKIHFEGTNVAADPVAGYLKRHGVAVVAEHKFDHGGTTLELAHEVLDASLKCPNNNLPYSLASGDTNPIHTNPFFSDLAGLPTTIVHGMWTSAATRKNIETFAADNHPERIAMYGVSFVGMVLPGDVLSTTLSHVGMIEGRKLLHIKVHNQHNQLVLQGSAEVEEASTAYVFTGQGSQNQGMGMDLYEASVVAKELWDRADEHLKNSYGFSILEIVRKNPKELTIHFGGKHGAIMRENYRKLVYEVQHKDGTMQALPLFPSITPSSPFHTFQSPKGLLNATQFTQPALTLMEVACYKDMEMRGLVQQNAAFAGHSLGEYSSLAALAEVLSIEALVDVVFYRGMTMQVAVPRDEMGRSEYGMVAINPGRVSDDFNQEALQLVVDTIKEATNEVLEIVNYNVVGQQYVASGELTALDCLANVLNYIKMEKIQVTALLKKLSKEQVEGQLRNIVKQVLERCMERKKANGGRAVVERGFATIPLPGIDVPFHSSFLLSGVAPFRELLKQKLSVEWVDVKSLQNRYIPNLVARPFDISKEFVELVYKASNSPKLERVLKEWKPQAMNAAEQQQLGYTLLVELLAYQFASPVRWIETQDVLFAEYKIERLVEIGPEPTLTTMASRTLKAKYEEHDNVASHRRTILHIVKNKDDLYYKGAEPSAPPSTQSESPAAPKPVAAAPAPAPMPAPAPVSAAPVADAPPATSEVLQVLVATRVRRPLGEITMGKSIKEVVGGKSTLQNEILGDLGQEFPGFQVDKPEEEPLSGLAGQIPKGNGQLGKVTSGMVAKMVSSKMPGGFGMGQVKAHLASHGLGAGRTDGALLFALTMEPAARLPSEGEAKKWLDSVVSSYATARGVTLSAPTTAAVALPTAAAPAVAAAAAPVPDAPVTPMEFVRVLVSTKLKAPPSTALDTKSIKEVVGGKSTLQNEILGDLQQEFGDAASKVDSAAEIPMGDLAKAMSHYKGLGKYANKAVSKLISQKMPGSFGIGSVKGYLASKGLGAGRQEGVLLHALALEPSSRLASEGDAKAFWDSVVDSYSKLHGVSLGGGGGAVVAAAGPAVSSAALQQFEQRHHSMVREQIELLSAFVGDNLREGWHAAESAKSTVSSLQAELDAIRSELGDAFVDGIMPQFTRKKARQYEASWNWVREDYFMFLIDMATGVIAPPTLTSKQLKMVHHVMNRADKGFVEFIEYYTKVAMARGGRYFQKLRDTGYMLAREIPTFAPVWMLDVAPAFLILSSPPLFTPLDSPTAPCTTISESGEITYKEIPRSGVATFAEYAKSMAQGVDLSQLAANAKVRKNLFRLQKLVTRARVPRKELAHILEELNLVGMNVGPVHTESDTDPEATNLPKREVRKRIALEQIPILHLKGRSAEEPMHFEYNKSLTTIYLQALRDVANNGISFAHKVALCTGCGRGSIGIEIVKMLIAGGCKVICTTSSFSKQTCDFYRAVYEQHGSKGSGLIVLPFNGGSTQDVTGVVDYIYDDAKAGGLDLDLDFIIPFAAITEQGMEIDGIGSRSELAHRIMLTNVLRLLGCVKKRKAKLGQLSRPTQVLLPMSPNHGLFGSDGLYAESKIGLETLFNKWHSEHWGRYVTIVGASIGWTRGTGLMAVNNLVAEGIEKLGVRTFSTQEMAFNLVSLMHPRVVKLAERDPVWADLNGGLHLIENLNRISANLRATIREVAELRSAVSTEKRKETEDLGKGLPPPPPTVEPRANMTFPFPKLKGYDQLHTELGHLKGMVDPSQVVVITGYGEVGPWGNSRTRWEIEAQGEFSLEGCIEMAWIMGFITYKNDPKYSGWTDTKTGKHLTDLEVKKLYEKDILAHSGVRIIEPELFDGYNPAEKTFLHQVSIDHDMAPVECSEDEARSFKLLHKDAVDIWEKGDGIWVCKLQKGAQLYIPKALRFTRTVAGQIPTGWSAERYGIPKDIVNQVDPVTLFTLVSTVEALVSSGVTDPYEFYKYIHVSELGNTSGGGIGGMKALQGIFRKRLLDQPVQKDILQESFINVMAAWVNLLLLSSSGPIKTPVGACATAVESVEIGVDTILSGKAKVVIAGGYDDFTEEGSYEFANMKATSDAAEEMLKGRTPREMSRPTTTSRAGFMESQGAGMHVMMSAETAFEMGVPIYGIVALTNTATDKEGRSVPAPGQGILSTARETRGVAPPRSLDFNWRKRQLEQERAGIAKWVEAEFEYLRDEIASLRQRNHPGFNEDAYLSQRSQEIRDGAQRKERAALNTYGQGFYRNNPSIAPLRGALAVWGLDVDDISVASFHGTSTQANDLNESEVVNRQLSHMGRSRGNILPTVFQKWLTGHPKGAAAAWMLNGCLQMMEHSCVPGNRNADDVDRRLSKFSHLFFPAHTLHKVDVRVCLLKSFGFGQVGGECLLLHPDYILATLDESAFLKYKTMRDQRQKASFKHMHLAMTGGKLVNVKTSPPYTDAQLQQVLLDPYARASYDVKTGSYSFAKYRGGAPPAQEDAAGKAAMGNSGRKGIGCDVEMTSSIPMDNPGFFERNYTSTELDLALRQANPRVALTGLWAAKEAAVKAVSNFQPPGAAPLWEGPSAPLKDIEIIGSCVKFAGAAQEVAKKAGVNSVKVAISESPTYAMAVAEVQ